MPAGRFHLGAAATKKRRTLRTAYFSAIQPINSPSATGVTVPAAKSTRRI
jgi:hypothetical protein